MPVFDIPTVIDIPTVEIPQGALKEARAKLENALSELKARDWAAVRKDRISFNGIKEMRVYRKPLVLAINAIEEMLAITSLETQEIN